MNSRSITGVSATGSSGGAGTTTAAENLILTAGGKLHLGGDTTSMPRITSTNNEQRFSDGTLSTAETTETSKEESIELRLGPKMTMQAGESESGTTMDAFLTCGYQLLKEDYSKQEYTGQQDKLLYGMTIKELQYSPVSNHPYPNDASAADPHSKHLHLGKTTTTATVATREWILQSNEVLFPFSKFILEGGVKAFDMPMFPQKQVTVTNEVDENGDPVLDADGNQVTTTTETWIPSPHNSTTFRNPITIAEHKHYVVGSDPDPAQRTEADRYDAKFVTSGGHGWNYNDADGKKQTQLGLLSQVDNEFVVECPSEFKKTITLSNGAGLVDGSGNSLLASSAPSYTDLVLVSGVVQHSSLTPQYTVVSIGGARLVQFHGAVKTSSGNSFSGYSTIMTIANTAARPAKTQMFKVPAYPGGGGAFGFVEIYSDGSVKLDMGTSFSTASISRLYLSSVMYFVH